jgi:diguanylate cyclase (GGDEF)-like protein
MGRSLIGRFGLGARHRPAAQAAPGSAPIKTPRPRSMGWLILSGVLLMSAIAAGTVMIALSFRDRALLNSERELRNTALLLSQHIRRELEALELVQRSVADRIRAEGIDTHAEYADKLARQENHLMLREKIVGLPQVSSIALIDAEGGLVSASRTWPAPDLSFSDRAYFKAFRSDPAVATFVSEPVRDRGTGAWTVVLARRLATSAGEFLGAVIGGIELARFESYFESITLGETSSISLFRNDGTLLARFPHIESAVGNRFSGLVDALGSDAARTTRMIGRMDGVDRLLSAHQVTGFPLVVVAGLEASAALADWRQQTRFLVGVGGASLLVTAFVLILTIRKMAQEHHWSKQRLLREKQRLDAAIANMPHGVCMFGPDRRLVVANDLYSTMYGLDPRHVRPGIVFDEVLNARVAAGSSPRDPDKYLADRRSQAFVPEPGYIIDELRDGRVIGISRRPMPDGGSVAIHQDITAQKRAEERITHLAHYDSLTSLANRVLLFEHINKAVEKWRRHGQGFAVHLLDLDRFKDVNDSLGHAVGDSLLFEVASRLRGCVEPGDVVARLGGDEFAVLQTIRSNAADEAGALARKFLQVIAKPFDIDAHQLAIETSIGIALAPDHALEADELLKKADLALYRAKSDGRNGWRVFEPAMEEEAHARLTLAMDLRNALAQGEFELHYQPVVSIAEGGMVGAEALLRWRSARRGLISPAEFIPLAEDTGLIIPLGEWILQRACADAAGWPGDLSVAVNLSPVQFRSPNLVNCVRQALAASGLPPGRLELEVTESVLLQHDEQNLEILHALKRLGIAIVLDDFGTGYSSMSYLLSFPFDKIKIDRTFVSDLTERSDCAAIVGAVAGLARTLDIATTGEGVETPAQLALLRSAGCTYAQGYLFGRPCVNAELQFGGLDLDAPPHRAAG